jgi:acyl-CoA dehydrogenase
VTGAFDLHLTDSQRELYEATHQLAGSVLKPIADAGRPGRLNRPLFKALAEHGLLPRLFSDGRAIDLCLIREALARACTDAETAFGTDGLGAQRRVDSTRRGRRGRGGFCPDRARRRI